MNGGISRSLPDSTPEGFFLVPETRELLEMVIQRGTNEDRARLRPLEDYLWALDPRQVEHNERHDQAHEELCDLVVEISGRWCS